MDSDTKTDVYAQFVQKNVRNTRDMKKLLDALRNYMPEQKYPPNSDNSKRRVLKLIEVFLDVISGEKTGEILLDFFNGRGRSFLRNEMSKALSEDSIDSILVNNLKSIVNAHQEEVNRKNTMAMAVRFNIIRAFIGIPGMGRNKLLEDGFLVGTHLWGHAYDDVLDNGLESVPNMTRTTGRRPVSDELRIAIKEHVLTDEYTKTLPASERSKTKDARALIKSIRQIYEEFPNNDEIGYDAFKNQLSGKKDSAVPNLRKWLHETVGVIFLIIPNIHNFPNFP